MFPAGRRNSVVFVYTNTRSYIPTQAHIVFQGHSLEFEGTLTCTMQTNSLLVYTHYFQSSPLHFCCFLSTSLTHILFTSSTHLTYWIYSTSLTGSHTHLTHSTPHSRFLSRQSPRLSVPASAHLTTRGIQSWLWCIRGKSNTNYKTFESKVAYDLLKRDIIILEIKVCKGLDY